MPNQGRHLQLVGTDTVHSPLPHTHTSETSLREEQQHLVQLRTKIHSNPTHIIIFWILTCDTVPQQMQSLYMQNTTFTLAGISKLAENF